MSVPHALRRGLPLALSLVALFVSPSHAKSAEIIEMPIPNVVIASTTVELHRRGAVLMRGATPYSGWLEERENGHVVAKTPFFDGLEEGVALGWYSNGALRYRKLYRKGRRQGVHVGYWPNGQLQFLYAYRDDVFEGQQISFYATGIQSELTHYREGHEDGRQQHWGPEGRLQSNYTFKDGRRYGLVGSSDCISTRAH